MILRLLFIVVDQVSSYPGLYHTKVQRNPKPKRLNTEKSKALGLEFEPS
jgi:hypothetical protein